MEIQILGRNFPLNASQLELVERRIQYALNRFSSQVRTVQVTLSDVNGPKGGSDSLCRFKVLLRRLQCSQIRRESGQRTPCTRKENADLLGFGLRRW